ncbi:hypothetical protein CPB84DRAFT_1814331 [Gymnopilus junonius]|uniref:Uncharacterized protein n=1 Tax=Gymnopilus junonius TaxID=109634 RepID=A0A9P5NSN8_GYMJU|nr:hypothetical protein CPB84DRAFT_1814331 [Gymnopilus junonius]
MGREEAPPVPKQHLKSTQDLLARFHLLPAYDRYVRPFITPVGEDGALSTDPNPTAGTPTHTAVDPALAGHSISGTDSSPISKQDKGKGKERDATGGAATPGADGLDAADAEDDDVQGAGGKGEKKKKNSYKHLIRGAPGKHSYKKDDYLTTTMLQPPKQRVRIRQFDLRTQQEAFTVSSTGIVGWNVHALIQESAQAREDRRRKEEAEKAATMQAQQPSGGPAPMPSGQKSAASTPLSSAAVKVGTPSSVSTPGHPPIQAPIPTTASAARRMSGAGVAKSAGTPKPAVATPRPRSTTTTTATPATTGAASGGPGGAASRPTSTVPRPGSAVPRPGSAVPRPGSGLPVKPPGVVVQQHPPHRVRPDTPMDVDQQRGKKREREREETNGHGVLHANGTGVPMVNGNGLPNGTGHYQHQQPSQLMQPKAGVINAKAGTGNVRPRPVKKQRMDMQGQARDVNAPVQQQPTPQGV